MICNLKGYATYKIFTDKNAELIKKIHIEDNIVLGYREDPSSLNWVDQESEPTLSSQVQLPTKKVSELLLDNNKRAFELIVYAENEDIAQDISNLIHAASLLIDPDIFHNPHTKIVNDMQIDSVWYEQYKQVNINKNMLLACLIVSKSWGYKELIYSLEKYRFSLELDSITPHSTAPREGQVFSVENRGYSYHVSAAYAFLSAYSIIEELGLDIRSNAKKHRFINNPEGKWNPVVKDDIIKRLSDIGIGEFETMTWLIRGTPSELYKEIKPSLGINTKWVDGEEVNDQEMKIYEAIHYCSYIRNFLIAHKFHEVVSSISPYDVHNVQILVRRLILRKLDLWNLDGEELRNSIVK